MHDPTLTDSLSCSLSALKSLSTNHTQMFMVFPQITQIKEARARGEGRRVLKRDIWTWYKQGQQAKKLCLKSEFDTPSSKKAQADGIHCLERSMRRS